MMMVCVVAVLYSPTHLVFGLLCGKMQMLGRFVFAQLRACLPHAAAVVALQSLKVLYISKSAWLLCWSIKLSEYCNAQQVAACCVSSALACMDAGLVMSLTHQQ
jgi:hypothetical protein